MAEKIHVCGEALLKDDDLARPQAAKRFLGPTPSALERLEASSALINQTRSFDLIKQAHDLTPLRGFQTPFFAVAPMRPRLSDRGATWCIRRAMVSLCIVDLNFGTGPSVTKLL